MKGGQDDLVMNHLFVPAINRIRFNPVLVNYGLTLRSMLKHGQYNWVHRDITEKKFPHDRARGIEEVPFELYSFGCFIKSDQVNTELYDIGFRSATLPEILAFGEQNPETQRDRPIMALGSVCQGRDGRRLSPCLYGGRIWRTVNLRPFDADWCAGYLFAAVPKEYPLNPQNLRQNIFRKIWQHYFLKRKGEINRVSPIYPKLECRHSLLCEC